MNKEETGLTRRKLTELRTDLTLAMAPFWGGDRANILIKAVMDLEMYILHGVFLQNPRPLEEAEKIS